MVHRVTAIECGPCTVLGKRTAERDGYSALILGFGEKREKSVNKPEAGFFKKIDQKPAQEVREFRLPAEDGREVRGRPAAQALRDLRRRPARRRLRHQQGSRLHRRHEAPQLQGLAHADARYARVPASRRCHRYQHDARSRLPRPQDARPVRQRARHHAEPARRAGARRPEHRAGRGRRARLAQRRSSTVRGASRRKRRVPESRALAARAEYGGRDEAGRPQDPFGDKAKKEGFAARSVYKLEEIDRRVQLFRRGMRVLDLGAFPGSWTLYAAQKVGREGRVLGRRSAGVARRLPAAGRDAPVRRARARRRKTWAASPASTS